MLSQHFISAVLCRCISEKSFWPRECVSELLKTKCVPARLVLKDLKPVLLVPRQSKSGYCGLCVVYTAISRKLSEKVHATIPKGIVGDLGFTLLQRHRQEWYERPWMYVWESYSVRNSVLIISHITFRDSRMHIFSHNLSRNSCLPDVAAVV